MTDGRSGVRAVAVARAAVGYSGDPAFSSARLCARMLSIPIPARVRLHLWCHALRHTSITQAADLGAPSRRTIRSTERVSSRPS